MMNVIALQNSYDAIEIGLFSINSDQHLTLLDRQSVSKLQASKLLIPLIDRFLKHHQITLADIPFIAVNQGPGPFTTLRVVIATANGISYATGIPLMGVNALEAIADAWPEKKGIVAVILNGFAHDLYYMLKEDGKTVAMGCKKGILLLQELAALDRPITFLGNGIDLYKADISQLLGNHALIPENYPPYSSLAAIALLGYQSWCKNRSGDRELQPIYLKQHPMQKNAPR